MTGVSRNTNREFTGCDRHLGNEGDDLCLAFALGVGTPWRHRSLIPGIMMLRVHSAVFTVKNNCPYSIAPATLTGSGVSVLTGFELESAYSGDCGSGQVGCNGAGGAPPATLAEFTIGGADGKDFFDVSLVDGFNLPVSIVPQDGCAATDCPVYINANCPSELAVKNGSGGTVGCKSACEVFGTPEYCCSGDHNTPDKCPPTDYSRFFKNLCPKAYSYAYDDSTSTFTCNTGTNYVITFCP
ncbi:thaumatin-like protein 1 [Tanacetum coccineum]|uniref:Thaumatin-like protein 1 n=1 Tax=Tanacetum coccineum TaxID=301880 RepID=A0ABQ4Z976_9ASTR